MDPSGEAETAGPMDPSGQDLPRLGVILYNRYGYRHVCFILHAAAK
jgi:hypothetical protein